MTEGLTCKHVRALPFASGQPVGYLVAEADDAFDVKRFKLS